MTPASVRYNNPGAQYPGQSARRFGSTGTEIIGGGHQIAVFPDPVSGAAAQFDLLRRGYAGLPLHQAINKWSGGNSAPQYVAGIVRDTGLGPDTVLTPELLSSPQGVALVKRMAQHEAGQPFPLNDQQWTQAQRMALGGPLPEGDSVAKPGSTEFWNQGRMSAGAPMPPPIAAQTPQMAPQAAPQQQGGNGLWDALMNPLTLMGLSILGSPTRDVGQGVQVGMQAQNQLEARRERARQQSLADAQRQQYQAAVNGLDPKYGNMRGVLAAAGPEQGIPLLAQLTKQKPPIEVNGKLIDPDTYQVVADFSKPKAPIEVAGKLVDPETGKVMADFTDPSKTYEGRVAIAKKNGWDLNDPNIKAWSMTGDLPNKDMLKMTPTEQKELWKSQDEMVSLDSQIAQLEKAHALNSDIYTGWGASTRAVLGNNLPDNLLWDKIAAPDKSDRTAQWENIMNSEAIKAMSETLKGASTDYEMRKFISDMADPSKTVAVRKNAVERVLNYVRNNRELLRQRVQAIDPNGKYGGVPQTKTDAPPQGGDIDPKTVPAGQVFMFKGHKVKALGNGQFETVE